MPTNRPIAFSPLRQTLGFLGWLLLCFAAAGSAYFVAVDGWYASLVKPSWNPPAWVFGPVWSVLYMLMATAAWLVWREGGWKSQRGPLTLFLVQWLLNAAWTPLFFGLHRPDLAMMEIAVFWCVLAITVTMFWRVRRLAGALMLPYLIWVSVAATLNFCIWRMNP
jgi:translocator protein